MKTILTLILLIIWTCGNSQMDTLKWKTEKTQRFEFYYTAQNEIWAKKLIDNLQEGIETTEAYFSQPFKKTFTVYLYPTRETLNEKWKLMWDDPNFKSECWMVASGGVSGLHILSPGAWKKEACEHDPDNSEKIKKLIIHELVHVYHGQYTSRSSLSDLEPIGWFVEGVATLVSKQLDSKRLEQVKEVIKNSANPQQLEEFWSGKARYGQSGYMVAYIEKIQGKNYIFKMLSIEDEATILQQLRMSETELIVGWKKFVSEL